MKSIKARLSFDSKREDGYSSEHQLEDFDLDVILPVGSTLRFDVPFQDDDGRWALTKEGAQCDGGVAIFAEIVEYEGFVCSTTQDHVYFVDVNLQVSDYGEGRAEVERLISYKKYLHRLKDAEKINVADSKSGFSEEQSHYLQRKDLVTVADVARQLKTSFHKDDPLPSQIEKILKEKWDLMFCAGSASLTYQCPTGSSCS